MEITIDNGQYVFDISKRRVEAVNDDKNPHEDDGGICLRYTIFRTYDISAFKPTKQQGLQRTDLAENAVDRSLSTCSSTYLSNPAWWYVDLQKVKSIYDVQIYFRLYNKSYGCTRDDAYGQLCNETCPSHCQERRCYVTNGTCVGCIDGWIGEKCLDACPAGFYGAECNRTCSVRCQEKSCNHVTGHCSGCISGWMGYDCNERCRYGTYGENCKRNCSGNCANQEDCNKESGDCNAGCVRGYRGSKCEEECDFGTYGANCTNLCSGNCFENKTCNKVYGECMDGCREGFKGTLCNEKCSHGKFGKMCKEDCSGNCLNNETCFHTNGHCLMGCEAGFQGKKCDALCSGSYGHNCEEPCSSHCLKNETCDIINGSCPYGCQEEYEGDTCKQRKGSALKTSETNAGNVTYGVVSGVVAVVVIVLVVVVEIPKGELHPCEVGQREENKDKNRYTTTFPYDHTRIILQESNKNDGYINANYIKEKCKQYWPNNSEKIQHGHFTIRSNEEKTYANYVTRKFHVQNIAEHKERDVRMFHYTQWPDHGVPEAINLVIFHQHFLRSVSGNSIQPKLLVHC
ncbi:multiple epidermal growth factor-like domains protein 10, partial [Saccostrea cucullata]|uniref:multiple epidermal growth factor-like domains protein 10 n=1 Tax=Saccostrea cuccullata TaxID=36930 RepID=UPI002ED561B9